MSRDSLIVDRLVNLPDFMRLDYLLSVHEQIQDDNCYWLMVATAWLDDPFCHQRLDDWLMLFKSTRRNRHKLMKKSDRKVWRGLPGTATAYRACESEDERERAIAWTLDFGIAEFFMKHDNRKRFIARRTFRKQDIIAYFDRRHEKEIIVIPQ